MSEKIEMTVEERKKLMKNLRNQKYYERHRVERIEHVKQKYIENRDKILEYKKQYRENNRVVKPPKVLSQKYEKQKESQKRYRERKKAKLLAAAQEVAAT